MALSLEPSYSKEHWMDKSFLEDFLDNFGVVEHKRTMNCLGPLWCVYCYFLTVYIYICIYIYVYIYIYTVCIYIYILFWFSMEFLWYLFYFQNPHWWNTKMKLTSISCYRNLDLVIFLGFLFYFSVFPLFLSILPIFFFWRLFFLDIVDF